MQEGHQFVVKSSWYPCELVTVVRENAPAIEIQMSSYYLSLRTVPNEVFPIRTSEPTAIHQGPQPMPEPDTSNTAHAPISHIIFPLSNVRPGAFVSNPIDTLQINASVFREFPLVMVEFNELFCLFGRKLQIMIQKRCASLFQQFSVQRAHISQMITQLEHSLIRFSKFSSKTVDFVTLNEFQFDGHEVQTVFNHVTGVGQIKIRGEALLSFWHNEQGRIEVENFTGGLMLYDDESRTFYIEDFILGLELVVPFRYRHEDQGVLPFTNTQQSKDAFMVPDVEAICGLNSALATPITSKRTSRTSSADMLEEFKPMGELRLRSISTDSAHS